MPDANTNPPKRRRGAQPGNLNALKHGFYARSFRHLERADLEALLESGLDSEIYMLRSATRRLLELSQDNSDVEQGIRLLAVLGITASRLANLMRAQASLGGTTQDETLNTIITVLEEVNKELCK